jgi:type 1 fimbria pilin
VRPLEGVQGDDGSPGFHREKSVKRILLAAAAAVSLGAFAAPAAADVCYDVSITLNGQTTAAAECVDTP